MPERYPQPKVESVRARVKAMLRVEDRGWETECYVWQGIDLDRNSYGRVKWQGKYVPVHRVFMLPEKDLYVEQFNDKGEKLELSHQCEVRTCCRPSHIKWETRQENLAYRDRSRND